MKATATLHDAGQSLWLDNITRDLLESGTLARYIAELSVTGLTSNPTIFDHAIKGSSDYDAAIRSKLRTGKTRRVALLRVGARGHHARCGSLPPRVRAHARRRRLRLARSVAAARARHQDDAGRRQGAPCARWTPEPVHQDPRHAGRPARHRGSDLRGRAHQRHAALLARALSRRRRCVPARDRAAHRCRPFCRRRFGRIALHQPLGRGRREQGARARSSTSSASRWASAATRRIATSSRRRATAAS